MEPRVTNGRSRLQPWGDDGLIHSVLELESTLPPRRLRIETGSSTVAVLLDGLRLNMDPYERPVLDGVVHAYRLAPRPDGCVWEIELDWMPSSVARRVEVRPGLPVVTRVTFSREILRRTLGGRRLAIDPGHGGSDMGARGPINLQERHVALSVAQRLVAHLEEAGVFAPLTRREDRDVPAHERFVQALAVRADALVSVHTGHESGPECRGIRVLFGKGPEQDRARAMAAHVHQALLERLRLPDRGLTGQHWPSAATARLPVVQVEAPCITHPLDEALLRSIVFKDRLAQAIRNGIAAYWRAVGGDGGVSGAIPANGHSDARHHRSGRPAAGGAALHAGHRGAR